jgi:hypothetical protein
MQCRWQIRQTAESDTQSRNGRVYVYKTRIVFKRQTAKANKVSKETDSKVNVQGSLKTDKRIRHAELMED